MKPLTIAPNKPVIVALVNPDGVFDFELGIGLYETTTGQTFTLPRPAVVLLNELDPEPGEEIVIQKHWSGRPGDKSRWTIALSTRSEVARANGPEATTLTEQLEASLSSTKARNEPVALPTPIRTPPKRQKPEAQPRLFDRGTGTDGPALAIQPLNLPELAPAARFRPGQIPANIAIREILAFIQTDPNTANWSDQARQDLASTVYIAAVKQGQVGLWERS